MLKPSYSCLAYLLCSSLSLISHFACGSELDLKIAKSEDSSLVSKPMAESDCSRSLQHSRIGNSGRDTLVEDVFTALKKDKVVVGSKNDISRLQKPYYPSDIGGVSNTLSTIRKWLGKSTTEQVKKACKSHANRCKDDRDIDTRIKLYLEFLSVRRNQKDTHFTKLDEHAVIGLLKCGATQLKLQKKVCTSLKKFESENENKQKFIEEVLKVMPKEWKKTLERVGEEEWEKNQFNGRQNHQEAQRKNFVSKFSKAF